MNKLLKRIKALASEYQEVVYWLPPAIALMFGTFYLFPQIDPRSGIDGLGQVHATIVNVVGGIIICFSAWLTKRNYLGIVNRADQAQWSVFLVSKSVSSSEKLALLATRALELLEWILCFAFWYIVVF